MRLTWLDEDLQAQRDLELLRERLIKKDRQRQISSLCRSSPSTPPRSTQHKMAEETQVATETETVNKNKRYRKPKPCDTDDIDRVYPLPQRAREVANIVYAVEGRPLYQGRQPESLHRRILIRNPLPKIPRTISPRELVPRHQSSRQNRIRHLLFMLISGHCMCVGFSRREYDCQDNQEDIRSRRYSQRKRSDKIAFTKCAVPSGCESSR